MHVVGMRQKSRSRETNKHPQVKSALILLHHTLLSSRRHDPMSYCVDQSGNSDHVLCVVKRSVNGDRQDY